MESSDVLPLLQSICQKFRRSYNFFPSLNTNTTNRETYVQRAEREFKLIYESEEISNYRLEPLTYIGARKNEALGRKNREDGNKAFAEGNHELAIFLYSEALRYSPVHETLYNGHEFASCAANRSASLFSLKDWKGCLRDIQLSMEAGYPTASLYKLYKRECESYLALRRFKEAQRSFDALLESLERSSLSKDLRSSIASKLQESFISSVRSEVTEVSEEEEEEKIPEWMQLKDSQFDIPSASIKVALSTNESVGRCVVANRLIEPGDVLLIEKPIVSLLESFSDLFCHDCFSPLKSGQIIPCPTCSGILFCSLKCRNVAMSSYHKFECPLRPYLKSIQFLNNSLLMMALRSITQKPLEFFINLQNIEKAFNEHDVKNGVRENDELNKESTRVFESSDYRNYFNLLTHREYRTPEDIICKTAFSAILVKGLEAVGYFEGTSTMEDSRNLIGRLLVHFMEVIQFNSHMIEGIYDNRVIAPDAETRMWKMTKKFNVGEFVEMVKIGGGIYPTISNLNHSCDPNVIFVNFKNTGIVVASRRIEPGQEILDTYGAVFYHMDQKERRSLLQSSHWFHCKCSACTGDWPIFPNLPRDYLKLSGLHFKTKRCNRKELQKDVTKLKKKISGDVEAVNFEEARLHFRDWAELLDELIVPPHQDYVNVRRGMRNCLWLQTPNILSAEEDVALCQKKAEFRRRKMILK